MKIKQVAALLIVLVALVATFLPQIVGVTLFVGAWILNLPPGPNCPGHGG